MAHGEQQTTEVHSENPKAETLTWQAARMPKQCDSAPEEFTRRVQGAQASGAKRLKRGAATVSAMQAQTHRMQHIEHLKCAIGI